MCLCVFPYRVSQRNVHTAYDNDKASVYWNTFYLQNVAGPAAPSISNSFASFVAECCSVGWVTSLFSPDVQAAEKRQEVIQRLGSRGPGEQQGMAGTWGAGGSWRRAEALLRDPGGVFGVPLPAPSAVLVLQASGLRGDCLLVPAWVPHRPAFQWDPRWLPILSLLNLFLCLGLWCP